MRRISPLLISLIFMALLLAHHVHAPVAEAGMISEPVTAAHAHHGFAELQVIDHGALDELVPELCVIDESTAPPTSGGHGQAALISAESRGEAILPVPSVIPSWEVPSLPPDVLRALLQVFLN